MPQMAPMSWLTLFIYFVMIFIFFNLINYFSFSYKPKTFSFMASKINKINWKW
uniref:ATP synthase complex subunit 8 n=1 Tax=Bolitobius castaneus TaxID=877873 RepID=A0A0S2M6U3_9COLE|nr:ATP synthase F0 subunit 8 [Bolitobius castaneus]